MPMVSSEQETAAGYSGAELWVVTESVLAQFAANRSSPS